MMVPQSEEELQTAHLDVTWRNAMTKMAAAAMRCSNNNIVAKRHAHCHKGVRRQKTKDRH